MKKQLLSLIFLLLSNTAYAFTDVNGKPDLISNHIGNKKWTIVEVWESNCPPCRTHMPEMVKFDGKIKNTQIISVSIDGQKKIKAVKDFIHEFNMKFPTIITNFSEMSAWMRRMTDKPLIGTPTFILFNREGKLVAIESGIVSTKSIEKFITENS